MDKKPLNSCPGRPELKGKMGMGMYHCEYCGAMVLAGLEHPSDEDVKAQGIEPYAEWIKSLGE